MEIKDKFPFLLIKKITQEEQILERLKTLEFLYRERIFTLQET